MLGAELTTMECFLLDAPMSCRRNARLFVVAVRAPARPDNDSEPCYPVTNANYKGELGGDLRREVGGGRMRPPR
jgi:hypothetical protein